MGIVEVKKGRNQVFFKRIGKNEKTSAQGFDLVTPIPQWLS
jgi:hypothetical protein